MAHTILPLEQSRALRCVRQYEAQYPEIEPRRSDVDEGLPVLVGKLARRLRMLACTEDAAEDLSRRCREVGQVEAKVQQRVSAPRVHLAEVHGGGRGVGGGEGAQEEAGRLRLLEGHGIPEHAVAVVVPLPAARQHTLRGEALQHGEVALDHSLPEDRICRAHVAQACTGGFAPCQQRRCAKGERGHLRRPRPRAHPQRGIRDVRRLGD
mmetsp:Transcript_59948/g.175214  ORF Transcript_59948/g.175214 Transcript_59948/m.175214 type:complete len:209 (-) Transcript_59948:50-676(-)